MLLFEAQAIIERVVENPEGSQHVTDREIAQAVAVIIVRNGLLAASKPTDGNSC